MLSNTHIQPMQSWRTRLITVGLRFAAALMLVGLFSFSSAFGQTDYSDFWVDDSNPDAAYIVGIGVTDNDYSADAIGVETTLTSPNGRTVTGNADDYASIRVEITLPWDWNDLGDYFVYTRHQPLCWGNWDGSMLYERRSGGTTTWYFNPDYYRCMESRTTYATAVNGVSYAGYYESAGVNDTCVYEPILGCNVACMASRIDDRCSLPAHYRLRMQAWTKALFGARVCLPGLVKVYVEYNPPQCRDVPP